MGNTTQSHLDIEDIRKDMVIMRNGNVALVLESTAINFELLSEQEQEARIQTFANLVNSLTFPVQIVVHTERTDVTRYIEKLREVQSRQASAALSKQIEIYIKFIRNLTFNNEVLDKRFFIVIPALLGSVQQPSFFKTLFGGDDKVVIDVDKILAKAQLELYPKRDHILRQFKKMGLGIRQLTTDELIHLYYSIYDPDKSGYKQTKIAKEDYAQDIITTQNPEK